MLTTGSHAGTTSVGRNPTRHLLIALERDLAAIPLTDPRREIALAYAGSLEDFLARHIVPDDIPPGERKKRWRHFMTILKLDGETLPDDVVRSARTGGTALLADIRRIIQEATPCTTSSVTSGASLICVSAFGSRAGSAGSSASRPL